MHHLIRFAYLDPGTGSLIVQSVIGVAAGVAFFGRRTISNFGHKLRSTFNKPKSDSEKSE